jgi:hypothetical protein
MFGRADPEAAAAFAALDALVGPERFLAQPRLRRRHWAPRIDLATARRVP